LAAATSAPTNSSALTNKSGTAGTTTVSNPWNATLRGRIGYAMDRLLIYGTGGLAVGRVEVDDTVGPTSEAATEVGWTAGAGIETALTDQVLGRVEYRYTDLGSSSFTPGSVSTTSHDVMFGIGFKF
jgi:outer membrane immunogenic protein